MVDKQLVVVELAEVLATITAVRARHAPSPYYTGSVHSEAQQTCDEIYQAVMAISPRKQEVNNELSASSDNSGR